MKNAPTPKSRIAPPTPTPTPTPIAVALEPLPDDVLEEREALLDVALAAAELMELVLDVVLEEVVEALEDEEDDDVGVADGLGYVPVSPMTVMVYGSPVKLTTWFIPF